MSFLRCGLILGLLGASGCASYSTRLSARPIPRGTTEIGLAADIWLAERRTDRKVLPVVEASIRYGLSNRVDIGGKINLLGGELNTKVALVRGEVLAMAIVPGVGAQIVSEVSDDSNLFVATFSLPVLLGVRLGESVELVGGPKFLALVPAGTSDPNSDLGKGVLTLLPGAVLGCRFILSDGFALFPELNIHAPYNTEEARWLRPVFQGGLGFNFLL